MTQQAVFLREVPDSQDETKESPYALDKPPLGIVPLKNLSKRIKRKTEKFNAFGIVEVSIS